MKNMCQLIRPVWRTDLKRPIARNNLDRVLEMPFGSADHVVDARVVRFKHALPPAPARHGDAGLRDASRELEMRKLALGWLDRGKEQESEMNANLRLYVVRSLRGPRAAVGPNWNLSGHERLRFAKGVLSIAQRARKEFLKRKLCTARCRGSRIGSPLLGEYRQAHTDGAREGQVECPSGS